MNNVEKAINRKYTPEERRYFPRVSDLIYLCNLTENRPFELADAAFNYGFEQGKRYEKARRFKE